MPNWTFNKIVTENFTCVFDFFILMKYTVDHLDTSFCSSKIQVGKLLLILMNYAMMLL